ncbi:MAG: hypothetical protein O7J95_07130 [Planctomycetota bacterium]|nr:hypothetical protein [Planctomycetota bacterium]
MFEKLLRLVELRAVLQILGLERQFPRLGAVRLIGEFHIPEDLGGTHAASAARWLSSWRTNGPRGTSDVVVIVIVVVVVVVVVRGLHDKKGIKVTREKISEVGIPFGRHEKFLGGEDIFRSVVVRRLEAVHLGDSESCIGLFRHVVLGFLARSAAAGHALE